MRLLRCVGWARVGIMVKKSGQT